MGVNATLDAAEGHFGQSAETLSLCLQLRQRNVGLVQTKTGSWLTDEPKEASRKGFSAETVRDAMEADLLKPVGTDEDDGPAAASLSASGFQLGSDVLAWIKERNAPKPVSIDYPVPPIVPAKGPCAEDGCDACDEGNPPGGNVDLCCLDCGHRSCEKGA